MFFFVCLVLFCFLSLTGLLSVPQYLTEIMETMALVQSIARSLVLVE